MTFNNVDIDYHGDTAPINHLVKSANGVRHAPSELNFECNLRTYKP